MHASSSADSVHALTKEIDPSTLEVKDDSVVECRPRLSRLSGNQMQTLDPCLFLKELFLS